jgi:hypothetical protein
MIIPSILSYALSILAPLIKVKKSGLLLKRIFFARRMWENMPNMSIWILWKSFPIKKVKAVILSPINCSKWRWCIPHCTEVCINGKWPYLLDMRGH